MNTNPAILDDEEVVFTEGITADSVIAELNERDQQRAKPECGIQWMFPTELDAWDADTLMVGVRGEVGALMWFTATDVHVPADGAYSHWVDYFSRYGHHMAVPSGAEVPVATAHAALYEYARTGTRPRCVDWVRLDDVRPPYPEQDA